MALVRLAHIVRETGLLTEPFIERRILVGIPDVVSEVWTETVVRGRSDVVHVRSRLGSPGGFRSRAFHHVPQLGSAQAEEYRAVALSRHPDLVHAHYLTTGVLAAACDLPLVVSAYGFDVSVMARRPLWRRAYRELAQRVGAVLVEGPYMRKMVIELGFPEDRVHVVRIAAGHDELEFAAEGPLVDGPFRFLIAGRLVEKKGHVFALRAVAALIERGHDVTMSIVGSGRLEADLRRTVDAMGLHQRVTFEGSLPRERYIGLLRTADLLLAPSVTAANGDSEGGAPTTILDAQAVGTIVVGSTHADIPFLIHDERTGYLAPEGDVAGLVATVERALSERGHWPAIRLAAREQILARHSDEALSSSLGESYRAALSR